MWQELKIKLNVDPVGLSALLEALKARVTSVLKFEGAGVTRCRFYGLPAAQNATVVGYHITWHNGYATILPGE